MKRVYLGKGAGIPLIERRALHRILYSGRASVSTFGPSHDGCKPPGGFRPSVSSAYLLGAIHDGTVRHRTIRICQKEKSYVSFLRDLIISMGGRAWTYREGRSRNVFVVEFSRSFLDRARLVTREDRIDYVRGYFDAEGGVPSRNQAEPYLYFAQKDRDDLLHLRRILVSLRIRCGRMHNPSARADPDYWRFYVSRQSHRAFCDLIGSWHPRKARALANIVRPRAVFSWHR